LVFPLLCWKRLRKLFSADFSLSLNSFQDIRRDNLFVCGEKGTEWLRDSKYNLYVGKVFPESLGGRHLWSEKAEWKLGEKVREMMWFVEEGGGGGGCGLRDQISPFEGCREQS
jgi:hypothetical protein